MSIHSNEYLLETASTLLRHFSSRCNTIHGHKESFTWLNEVEQELKKQFTRCTPTLLEYIDKYFEI